MTTSRPDRESASQIELQINGRDVELNEFVQRFIMETVSGMLRSLRGVEDVRTVNLSFTRGQD